MADDQAWRKVLEEEGELPEEEQEGPVLPRRPVSDTAEMDITPMIDITFLLLIFFLVCSTASVQTAVELPPARHGTGVSDRTSVVLTVADRGGAGPARVYLADGKKGKPLPDDEDLQAAEITQAVEQGCQYHPRCPHRMDTCLTEEPSLYPVGSEGHYARCHIYG